ncbi:predicted protein [Histoplasma capsulatum var. duboisii H88]|uniref:Predicted protein n=2 Tax=Ajellomyces capsulatus TaxID=5037 RepID=F0UKX2_AJEC8|nr:predicted protein [Histoplasma capsulatum H143]EGC46076.1 predicted protein [Histoplasma capsulatum var. duboisii H88]
MGAGALLSSNLREREKNNGALLHPSMADGRGRLRVVDLAEVKNMGSRSIQVPASIANIQHNPHEPNSWAGGGTEVVPKRAPSAGFHKVAFQAWHYLALVSDGSRRGGWACLVEYKQPAEQLRGKEGSKATYLVVSLTGVARLTVFQDSDGHASALLHVRAPGFEDAPVFWGLTPRSKILQGPLSSPSTNEKTRGAPRIVEMLKSMMYLCPTGAPPPPASKGEETRDEMRCHLLLKH